MSQVIVLIMGYNASGKTSLVEDYLKNGFKRFNRDTEGGTLEELHKKAEAFLIANKTTSIVLDNTYPTIESRKSIIAIAKKLNIVISCVWKTTSIEDAQLNACLRTIKLLGHLPSMEEIKRLNNPNIFPIVALYRYRKEFQKPTEKEGFKKVFESPFVRKWDIEYKNKAVILDYDGTLRLSKGKHKYPVTINDVDARLHVIPVLKAYKNAGYLLLGASNQSGIAKEILTETDARRCFDETNNQLGFNIDYEFCPHKVPPISCYCRKPGPGMGAILIEKYKLNPAQCIMVGDMGSDKSFAERCGFQFKHESEFFK